MGRLVGWWAGRLVGWQVVIISYSGVTRRRVAEENLWHYRIFTK